MSHTQRRLLAISSTNGSVRLGKSIIGRLNTRGNSFTASRSLDHIFRGGDWTLRESVTKHYAMWGLSADLVEELVRRKVETTRIVLVKPFRVFVCTPLAWKRGRLAQHGSFEEQYFLRWDQFSVFADPECEHPLDPWAWEQ